MALCGGSVYDPGGGAIRGHAHKVACVRIICVESSVIRIECPPDAFRIKVAARGVGDRMRLRPLGKIIDLSETAAIHPQNAIVSIRDSVTAARAVGQDVKCVA